MPMSKVVHVYGALTTKQAQPQFDQDDKVPTSTVTTACSKCGKEESVHKLIANLQNKNILRCREENKSEQMFTD